MTGDHRYGFIQIYNISKMKFSNGLFLNWEVRPLTLNYVTFPQAELLWNKNKPKSQYLKNEFPCNELKCTIW